MWTYNILFKIALYPEGINGLRLEEYEVSGKQYAELLEDDEIFEKYLCKETEAQQVIDHLYSIYKEYPNGEDIYDLKHIGNGNFRCKIIAEPYIEEDEIQDILWPDEIGDAYYTFVDGKFRSIDLQVVDMESWSNADTDTDKDEDDEDQHIFNGVYYADAMDMEAAIKEHFKWCKKREEWSNEATKENSIDDIPKEEDAMDENGDN